MMVPDTRQADDDAPISAARFLTVSGQGDRIYAPYAPALEALLRDHGALVEARMISAGHKRDGRDRGWTAGRRSG